MKTRTLYLTIALASFISFISEGKEPTEVLRHSVPERWSYASEFNQTLPTEDNWWKTFNDDCLDSLIVLAVNNNPDLSIATKRIALAKSAVRMAESGYYPILSASAGWDRSRSSGRASNTATLGIDFSWEIDIFGKVTSQANAKKALWQASKSDYDAVMVSLCANVATYYINLRTWQNQYEVALSHINSQKMVLEMTEARYNSGLASMLDVSQAKTMYLSTVSTLLPLEANIETQINNLAYLIGIYKSQLPASITKPISLPNAEQFIPVGVPMDLLRRRPDVKEAEYTLASYAEEIGVAKKDFLPTLSLDGQIGFKSNKFSDLFDKNSFTYTIAPTLSWTIFNGLERKYQLIEAKEQYMIGIENYNGAVTNAVNEVDNALITYKYMLQDVKELQQVTNEAYNALQLSIDLYKRGLSSFTNVLTSQQTYLQYNNELVTSKGKSLLALISIYQALGGGWENQQSK